MNLKLRRTHLSAPPLPPGRPRLVVAGFMGTGKTRSGRVAADELGLPFIDLDEIIERRGGRSVREIFARGGEAAFRSLEHEVMLDAAQLSAVVVSAGGGAVLDGPTFAELAAGAVVAVLTCDPSEVVRRLEGGPARPLLEPDRRERVAALLGERAAAYESAGEWVDTTSRTPLETGRELARRYRERAVHGGHVTIEVPGTDGVYPVVIGPGAIDVIGDEVVRRVPDAARAAVVCDEAVHAGAAARVRDVLLSAGLAVGLPVCLPAGEESKSAATLAALWGRLHEQGLDRSDVVVAVGGGAALDVAGFGAATYARGVASVNVPTTLLAMVDAGLGGKVGIDHAGVKNRVGAFHHPILVVNDPLTLDTIPPRALRSGLAECVKAGLVGPSLLLDVLEDLGPEAAVSDHLPWVIEQSIRVKAAFVAADPCDRGVRRALNLGHTFAHAIEAASGFGVGHGEAVAVGLVAAARLGAALGVSDPALAGGVERLLLGLGLPVRIPGLDRSRLLAAISADKKRRGGQCAFVVPAPGGVTVLEGADLAPAAVELLVGTGEPQVVGG